MTDLRHPPVRGALFDYGGTLVHFERPVEALREGYATIAALLRERLPRAQVPEPEELIRRVHDRVDAAVEAHEHGGKLDEIALEPVYARAYAAACGVELDAGLVDELVRLEQRAWFAGVRPDPEAAPTLVALRDSGLRVGLCSNAPFHGATLREQIEHAGLAVLLDSITLSSDAGCRKPAVQLFHRAVADLGTPPEATVHIGDRSREDVEGAHAAGLRAVLVATAGQAPPGSGADAVIHRLGELVPLLTARSE